MNNPKVIISEAQLRSRVRELGEQITRAYNGCQLDIICLLNGGSLFCADLVRHIGVPIKQHYLSFSTYANGNSSGEVRITLAITEPLQGRHLLVVEGIVVSGRTPSYIFEMLKLRQPANIALCALAVKPKSLSVNLPIQYAAFELGAEIAVGYGVGEGPERTLPCLVEAA